MITILIYNQVAPAHIIMVLISNNDNLQPSGPCSHDTQKQEQLIYNQVAPAHMALKQ